VRNQHRRTVKPFVILPQSVALTLCSPPPSSLRSPFTLPICESRLASVIPLSAEMVNVALDCHHHGVEVRLPPALPEGPIMINPSRGLSVLRTLALVSNSASAALQSQCDLPSVSLSFGLNCFAMSGCVRAFSYPFNSTVSFGCRLCHPQHWV